jgi:hypothetical protein
VDFREQVEEMDAQLLDGLGDRGLIEGREVVGYFDAPWLQPQFGNLKTGVREPRFVIRVADAVGVEKAQSVRMDLSAVDGGGDYTVVSVEPSSDGLVALILRMKA